MTFLLTLMFLAIAWLLALTLHVMRTEAIRKRQWWQDRINHGFPKTTPLRLVRRAR